LRGASGVSTKRALRRGRCIGLSRNRVAGPLTVITVLAPCLPPAAVPGEFVSATGASGGGRGSPVRPSLGQKRPRNASHLVGERHCRDLERASRQQPLTPVAVVVAAPGVSQARGSAEDQEASQHPVALFGDAPQPFLATARSGLG